MSTTFNHDWDSLPGESASHIADAEAALKRVADALDDQVVTYELSDVREDLNRTRDFLTEALRAVDAALAPASAKR